MAVAPPPAAAARVRKRAQPESMADWRWGDRIAYVACWAAGLSLCLIAAMIMGYMAYKGLQYLKPSLLWSHPSGEVDQSQSGGFLDPILGTIILTVIGICIATPLAVATALWVVEYGRPRSRRVAELEEERGTRFLNMGDHPTPPPGLPWGGPRAGTRG